VAVVDGRVAARTAARAGTSTSTTSAAGATRAAAGVARRLDIPVHAVQRLLQVVVYIAVVAELTVVIQAHEVGDRLELLFGRGAACGSEAGIMDGRVGESGDVAGIAAEQDRIGAADRDLVAADDRRAVGVGHGDYACAHQGLVAAVDNGQAVCVQRAAVAAR